MDSHSVSYLQVFNLSLQERLNHSVRRFLVNEVPEPKNKVMGSVKTHIDGYMELNGILKFKDFRNNNNFMYGRRGTILEANLYKQFLVMTLEGSTRVYIALVEKLACQLVGVKKQSWKPPLQKGLNLHLGQQLGSRFLKQLISGIIPSQSKHMHLVPQITKVAAKATPYVPPIQRGYEGSNKLDSMKMNNMNGERFKPRIDFGALLAKGTQPTGFIRKFGVHLKAAVDREMHHMMGTNQIGERGLQGTRTNQAGNRFTFHKFEHRMRKLKMLAFEDSETKLMKETPYELLEDNKKKKIGNNNEAKMTLYNDLPRKEAKVIAMDQANDLATLPLDELIRNLKVYEMVLDNDGVGSKTTKEKEKSLALKAKVTRVQTSNDS
nr:ankyrin repeat-containing protein [Tanacetum cinerariifolium]